MVNWTGYILSAGQAIQWVLIILLIIVILGLLSWWIINLLRFNKRVVLRTMTGGGNVLIRTTWARQFRDKKSGAYFWKIKKVKEAIPRPPAKAIAIAKGGKEWVDLYDIGQGQFVPTENSNPEIITIGKEMKILGIQVTKPLKVSNSLIPAISSNPQFAQDETFIKSFQPITESQRSAYVDQMDKAIAYRKKGWQELLQLAIPILGMVMIIAVFLLFIGEGMTPIIEQAKIAQSSSKDFRVSAEIMREAVQTLRGHQVIGQATSGNFTPPD